MGIDSPRVSAGGQQPAHQLVALPVHGDVECGRFTVEATAVDGRAVVEQVVDDVGGTDVDRSHQGALVIGARADVSDGSAGFDQQANQPDVAGAGRSDQCGRPRGEPEPRLEALRR